MRGIEDTLIESVDAGTLQPPNGPDAPYVAVERETGRDNVFHGFFAIRLDAVIDPAVRKDAKRETELVEQLKFVESLMALEIGQSVQLRLIARPNSESWMCGRIDVVLIFHSAGDSEERALESSVDLWRNVRTYLASLAERYEFSPVIAASDISSLLRPFDCHEIAEIGRRERVLSLNGREGLFLVCPFAPTSRNMSRVCAGLLAQPNPTMFCVTIRSTRLSPTEQQYFEGHLVRRSLAQHPGIVPLQDTVQFDGHRPGDHGTALADAGGRALQMVHVASEGDISSALMGVIGSEISHPVAGSDLSKDLLDRPYSGGFVWQRAVGSAEARAYRSVLYQECDPWMDSRSPEGLERVRYLVDPLQGSAAFRIPFSSQGEAIQGIRIEPNIPFPPQPTSHGTLVGLRRYGMVSSAVRVDLSARQRHCYIQGATGTGKTTMIINMVSQDICADSGVIVIDFHGDLCRELLQRIPRSRINDVVYFNPVDTEFPIGLNLLAYDAGSPYREQQKERVIDCMTTYLTRQFPREMIGPMFFQALRNALHLIMANDEEPGTLLDLPLVFFDEPYMRRKLAHMPPSLARKFWEQGYNHKKGLSSSDGGSFAQYITSKFSSLVDMSLTRNMFGQVTSKLNFRDVMDQRKILLCNFSKGLLGGALAELLSFITLFKIEDAALSRADIEESHRMSCALYIDECQNLQTEHFPQLLAEMRKYGINMTLCNRHFSRLASEMQDSIIANCGTLVLFRSGLKDAEALDPALFPFDKRLMLRQPNFRAVVRTLVDGAVKLFTVDAPPADRPDADVADPQELIEQSRTAFGARRCEVEDQILAKLNLGQPAVS